MTAELEAASIKVWEGYCELAASAPPFIAFAYLKQARLFEKAYPDLIWRHRKAKLADLGTRIEAAIKRKGDPT